MVYTKNSVGIYQTKIWYIPNEHLVYTYRTFGIYLPNLFLDFENLFLDFGNLFLDFDNFLFDYGGALFDFNNFFFDFDNPFFDLGKSKRNYEPI
ncbi:MAG: hypothetical protein LBO06_00695 [Bacteroidales bacterium]|nr:hypothetical protein [Bacteroidales bacterium]